MIVFLTLCYVGALALLVKLGVVTLNLWWKLSPLVWMLLLFLVLFLPMQWAAPGGSVNVFQYVVEIIPNVNGEVIEVPVAPLAPLEPGDVLFRIDPVPFQAKVDELEAQLAATIQNVEILQAEADAAAASVTKTNEEIDIQKTDIQAAAAKVVVAETSVEQAKTNLEKAATLVANLKVQVAASLREFERRKELAVTGAVSQSEVDQIEVQYTGLLSQLNNAESDLLSAEHNLTSSQSTLVAEKASARGVDIELKQLVDAELPRAKALAREAKLAAESTVGGEHTSIADAKAKLAAAQYDLDQTTVRAPSSGHVAYLTLRPGQRVANLPLRSWMAFVDEDKTEVVVTIAQYALRNVRPKQKAEVTFKMFPGKVFNASVNRIAYINSAAQLQPSGQLAPSSKDPTAEPMGVVLDIDDQAFESIKLAGGANGSAAIYTDSLTATHIIRRVMLRMDAWTNYVLP